MASALPSYNSAKDWLAKIPANKRLCCTSSESSTAFEWFWKSNYCFLRVPCINTMTNLDVIARQFISTLSERLKNRSCHHYEVTKYLLHRMNLQGQRGVASKSSLGHRTGTAAESLHIRISPSGF